jgi:hypothetical protein
MQLAHYFALHMFFYFFEYSWLQTISRCTSLKVIRVVFFQISVQLAFFVSYILYFISFALFIYLFSNHSHFSIVSELWFFQKMCNYPYLWKCNMYYVWVALFSKKKCNKHIFIFIHLLVTFLNSKHLCFSQSKTCTLLKKCATSNIFNILKIPDTGHSYIKKCATSNILMENFIPWHSSWL